MDKNKCVNCKTGKNSENEKEIEKSSSKRTHFRRPHWATYHVGKGRTETIVKWLDTILVNTKNENGLEITVHKIK